MAEDDDQPRTSPLDAVSLTEKAARAVQRGGDDTMTEDQMLIAEIVARAPGMSSADLEKCFVAIRVEYGEDALDAIRKGYVRFDARKPQ